jgi:hypothetical protein
MFYSFLCSVVRVDTKDDFFYFAKYEIQIYSAKFRNNNFAKFREISLINVAKFRRQILAKFIDKKEY